MSNNVLLVRTRVIYAVSAFAAAVVCVPLSAQGPLEKGAAPIAVEVSPGTAAAGSIMKIHGTSIALQSYDIVKITVQPPQAEPVSLQTKVKSDGAFTTSFIAKLPGSYTVVATSPDGKATAQTTFSVMSAAVVSQHNAKAIERLIAETREGSGTLRERIAAQPASPPQSELQDMLDEFIAGLDPSPAVRLRQGFIPLDKLVQKYPAALTELQPAYDALAETAATAEEMTDEMRERLKHLQVNRLCDDIHAAGEALAFVSLAMSMTLSGVTTVVNVLVDKTMPDRVLSRVPELGDDPDARFMVAQAIKQAYAMAQDFATFAQAQVGLVNDIAQFATEKMFGAYCEKFEGPVSALFHLEYYEGSERWYAYDVTLDGKLSLRYQKGGAGSATAVSGEFAGSATKFTVWENLIVLKPSVRRYLVARKSFAPVAVPAPAELGQIGGIGLSKAGATGIHYFNVPVSGILDGEELALEFADPLADYDGNAKAKVIYIFVEPMLPIPEVYLGEFPYLGAHYILTRATRREPTFKVMLDKGKKQSRFTRTFERKEHKPGSYLLTWKLNVEGCNPGC